MHGLTTSWGIAARRIFTYRGVSLAVAAGILVAAVVLAFIPAYERAMSDLGVRFNIDSRTDEQPRATVYAPTINLGTGVGPAEEHAVTETTRFAGWFLTPETTALRSSILRGTPLVEGRRGSSPEVFLGAVEGMEDRVTILEGEFPQPGELGVVMGPDPAGRLNLGVGDQIAVDLALSNCFPPPPGGGGLGGGPPPPPCEPSALAQQTLTFTIVGLVEPIDPADSYWTSALFRIDRVEVGEERQFFPIGLNYDSMRTVLGDVAPGMSVSAAFVFAADIDAIDAGNNEEVMERFASLGASLQQNDMLLSSQVDDALRQFAAQSDFSAAPIRLLAFQAALVVIFYVLIVGSLLSDQLLAETVLLRARGASLFSILSLAFFQGATFAIPGAIAAPFIAAGIVALLGYAPAFDLPSVGDTLPFVLTPAAFVYAAAGALIATLAATIPTVLSARMSPAEERRRLARTDLAPFFQRYFLDLGALAVAGALIIMLLQEDAAFDRNTFGGLSGDPLLLLAPSIFGLAAVAVLLRVLPLLLRLAAGLLRPAAGPSFDMALVSLSRASGRYARLVALLVLVFALGAFAATFAPTIEASFEDRTLYEVGPDIRSDDLTLVSNATTETVTERVEAVEGVDRAMPTYRSFGAIGVGQSAAAQFQVLAVDGLEFPGFVDWRDDFADGRDEGELLGVLAPAPVPPGIELPGTPDGIAVDVRADSRSNTNIWARILDANGRAHLVDMGKLGQPGWATAQADFGNTFTLGGDIAYPLRLLAFHFTEPTGFFAVASEPITLDNVRAIEGGSETLVESFEDDASIWDRFSVVSGTPDVLSVVASEEASEGGRVLQLETATGRAPRKRGIYPASPVFPVSAVASESFLGAHGLSVGSQFELTLGATVVPVRVAGVTDLAPTLSPTGRGFILLDRAALFAWSLTTNEDPVIPNEVWVSLDPGADPAEVAVALEDEARLSGITIRAAELAEIAENPTLSAGASGLLWFGFVSAFLVLCLAVILSLALDAAQRRVQFAVIRAMGFAGRSVYVVLALEYAVIVAIGAVAGILLGLQVSRSMTGFLEFTETGDPVRPPFILITAWGSIAIAALAFAVFVALGVILAGRYLARASIARSIRQDA